MLDELSEAIKSNDRYLSESLIPAIRSKSEAGLTDEDILLAIEAGEGDKVFGSLLMTMAARVAAYSGAWWSIYNRILGDKIQEKGKKIIAYLDPLAHHCSECPEFQSVDGRVYDSFDDYLSATGGRVPGEFECRAWCRCWLAEE